MIFNVVMVVVSLSYLYFIIRNINKNEILLENAGIWIIIGVVMLISSLNDHIPTLIGHLLGFQLTSNFILFLAIFFLLILTFRQSVQLSKQKNQITQLIQELSLNRANKRSNKQN